MKICKLIPVLFVLLSFQTALALGVTRPVPHDMELMRGESADFSFQIQAITSTEDISCVYSLGGMEPLEIKFDSDEKTVGAGSKEKVYGTVTVPEGTPFGTYSSTLSVSCGGTEGGEGGSQVRSTIGGSPFSVEVVEFREKEIREVRPEQEIPLEIIILIIIVIILIIGAYYWSRKPPAKKKQPRKTKKKKSRKK